MIRGRKRVMGTMSVDSAARIMHGYVCVWNMHKLRSGVVPIG